MLQAPTVSDKVALKTRSAAWGVKQVWSKCVSIEFDGLQAYDFNSCAAALRSRTHMISCWVGASCQGRQLWQSAETAPEPALQTSTIMNCDWRGGRVAKRTCHICNILQCQQRKADPATQCVDKKNKLEQRGATNAVKLSGPQMIADSQD